MNKITLRSPYGPIYAAAIASLAFFLLAAVLAPDRSSLKKDMLDASRLMARAEAVIRDCRSEKGLPLDARADPNRTGLVGLETSIISTSLGNLAAKRTTANPNFAGLLVRLLDEAGVRRGDAVAVGASGSFPALIIAALSAAKVMDFRPLVIASLGASEWGANDPRFIWLDIEDCLRRAGLLDYRPIALAVGGVEDVGRDMGHAGRELLRSRIKESGIPAIDEPSLEADVRERVRLYEAAAGSPIRAFINIGGSWANIGTSSGVLKVRPGLAGRISVPPPGERGVLQVMAARGVPVIHLLNVRGLAERYGLPWDPRPLPAPGSNGFDRLASASRRTMTWLSAVYILFIIVILAFSKRVF
jgi:poly-gamma-glutamate system protein